MNTNIRSHPNYPYLRAAVLCELRSSINDLDENYFTEEDHVNKLDGYFMADVSPNMLAEILEDFVKYGIFEEIRDGRAGSFFRLSKEGLLSRYNEETADSSSLTSKYSLIGEQFLTSALQSEDRGDENFEGLETKSVDIPAAGRVVEIDHNQASAIEKPTAELIEALEADNGLSNEPGFRQRVLGQIKAGRELIRAGVFDAKLFYLSMIVGLKMLVEKYKEHAIGAAASKLVDLIYENIGSSLT